MKNVFELGKLIIRMNKENFNFNEHLTLKLSPVFK